MRKFVAIWIGLVLIGCGGNEQQGSDSSSQNMPQTSSSAEITGEPTRVVAQVGDEQITLGDVNRVVQAIRMSRPRDIDPNAPNAVLQKKAVDNLVDQKVLVLAAREQGMGVKDDEFDVAVAQVKARFPTPEAFTVALGQQGMTEEQFLQSFRADMTIRNFVQKAFADTVTVTPEQARAYFDAHPDEFTNPESVHARHILMRLSPGATPEVDAAAHDRAQTALTRIRAGEDFVAVASEISEDETTKGTGGDLGFFLPGQMVAPFDSVSFALSPGAVSDLVKTQFGYHIIKVEEKRPAGPMNYDEIESQLISKLQQDRVNEHVTAYLESHRDKFNVKRDI
ncbi:MAG: peptidylprolyl isomerase [Candidatus Eisenbacteria bacterium]|uniref:Peptidylprolyl isomerase n=1 Tax=Eiseniibacteriota bacterium TaxID=2212470 RepID=A0A956M348_UNCEI|nr:peptidylprolyl isomerase [Candidatus Eisenbacteria bacterium]